MYHFSLNSATVRRIHAVAGLDANEISKSDIDTIDSLIEKHIGKMLIQSVNLGGLLPRESVYLMFRRLLTTISGTKNSRLDSFIVK